MNDALGQSSVAGDDIQQAISRLLGRMRRASDPHPVNLEMLEDDLREWRSALEGIQDYLDETVRMISRPETRICDLVDLADDPSVLDQVEYLTQVVGSVRKRLLQLAAQSAS